MGSFHSDDVDDLMMQDNDQYRIPQLPFDTRSAVPSSDPAKDFMIDRKNWTFLNHGAFGGALRVGYYRAQDWRFHLEQQPLHYFDRDLLPHLVYSARRLAKFCNASRSDLTLIQNATSGLNTIIGGYVREFGEDSHIVLWDTTYGSVKKMAKGYCNNVTEIAAFDQYRTSKHQDSEVFEAAFLDTVMNKFKVGGMKNALLILDHTTSNTAINMPIPSLAQKAKEMGMMVLVDGAHGLLAQPLDLASMENLDFYVGNCHKWMSCPRGIGFLFCPDQHLRETVLKLPAVISHGVGQGYQSRFLWDGCRDYSAALSLPAVLDYWEQYGVETVQREMKDTCDDATHLLTDLWYSSSSPPATLLPPSMHAPMMSLIRLPPNLQKKTKDATSTDAKKVQDCLYENGIEVPIKNVQGELYVRISCHVYNRIDGYDRLGRTILKLPKLA